MSWLLTGLMSVLRETRAATCIMYAAIRVSLFPLLVHTTFGLFAFCLAGIMLVWLPVDQLVTQTAWYIQGQSSLGFQ